MKARLLCLIAGAATAALALSTVAWVAEEDDVAEHGHSEVATLVAGAYADLEESSDGTERLHLLRQFRSRVEEELSRVGGNPRQRAKLLAAKIEITATVAPLIPDGAFLDPLEAEFAQFLTVASADGQFDGFDAVYSAQLRLAGSKAAIEFIERVLPRLCGVAEAYARTRLAERLLIGGDADAAIKLLEGVIAEGASEYAVSDARGWLHEAKYLRVGMCVPEVRIPLLSGGEFGTRGRSRPAVVTFVRSDCAFSARAIPLLRAASSTARDFEFIAVFVGQTRALVERSDLLARLSEIRGLHCALIRPKGAAAMLFNATVTPRTMVLDKDGILLWDDLKAEPGLKLDAWLREQEGFADSSSTR